jgi:hypothetical protein
MGECRTCIRRNPEARSRKSSRCRGSSGAVKAERLIIDLRRNGGGAFAVVPLIAHLIDDPIDAGLFVVGS